MPKLAICLFAMALAAEPAFTAEQDHRFVQLFHIPSGREVAVVAEGDFEPRSVGSYALRIYGGVPEQFPTDDFIAGVVRPRDGVIEAVRFDDLDGDGTAEIEVVIRAVGSGGYLSADAFRYRNRSIEFLGSVADLNKGADVIQALRDKLTHTEIPQVQIGK